MNLAPLPFDEIDPDTIDLATQLSDAKREAAMRRNVYGNWVRSGRMKAHDAALRYAAMIAIVRTLAKLIGET